MVLTVIWQTRFLCDTMQWPLCGSEFEFLSFFFFRRQTLQRTQLLVMFNCCGDFWISFCLLHNFECFWFVFLFGWKILCNNSKFKWRRIRFFSFIAHVFCPEGALWLGISCTHICEDQMFFLGQLEIKNVPPLPKQLSARTKSELN